jgi:hypothetical protein
MKKLLLSVALISQLARPAHAATTNHVTSPEESFGFKPGADRKLADWQDLTRYYQKLASQTDRVRYAELGKTTEGRPFVALTISAPENLAHVAEYQEIQRKLADPRLTSPEEAVARRSSLSHAMSIPPRSPARKAPLSLRTDWLQEIPRTFSLFSTTPSLCWCRR